MDRRRRTSRLLMPGLKTRPTSLLMALSIPGPVADSVTVPLLGHAGIYEYHINGDIGLSIINQWVASGDNKTFKESFFPIYNSVATMYADLLVRNESYWTLKNMTDPVSK